MFQDTTPATFQTELQNGITALGLGPSNVWTDTDRKTVQKAIVMHCALGVIEAQRTDKASLYAAIEKELALFLSADNDDFVPPEGLTYDDLRHVNKGKLLTGQKAWVMWLESRKECVKYSSLFSTLHPKGKKRWRRWWRQHEVCRASMCVSSHPRTLENVCQFSRVRGWLGSETRNQPRFQALHLWGRIMSANEICGREARTAFEYSHIYIMHCLEVHLGQTDPTTPKKLSRMRDFRCGCGYAGN